MVAVVAGAGFWFLGPGKKAPAAQQTELPFTGLNHPQGIAVGADGTVYVADRESKRIVALAKGADTQKVLPFTDLAGPWGVAVDHANTVYVTDLDANKAWLAAVGWAADLVRWFQLLCLTGPLAGAEPKTLRWRLWHTPARVIRKSRRHVIRLLDGWPDTTEILAAYGRIAALG